MDSGELNCAISEQHFLVVIAITLDSIFVQRTCHPRPALIAKKPLSGHRMWKRLQRRDLDPNELERVNIYEEVI